MNKILALIAVVMIFVPMTMAAQRAPLGEDFTNDG